MAKAYPNYITALLKFAFDHKASIEDIKGLLQTLQDKKQLLMQLGSPQEVLDDYSNREPVAGVRGFEQLTDMILNLERMKEAKWLIDAMPKQLRDQFRGLKMDDKLPFVTNTLELSKQPSKVISSFVKTIGKYGDRSINEFLADLAKYVKGHSNLDISNKMQEIVALKPEAAALYQDNRYLAISVRTEKAQKGLCSVGTWCINSGSYDSYTKGKAIQLNIYDFDRETDDPMFLTGTTISYDGKVTSSSNKFNKSLKDSSSPAEHFTAIGYPDYMVDAMVSAIPREIIVKRSLDELGLDLTSPSATLFHIIKQSYRVNFHEDEEATGIIFNVVDTRLKANLKREEILKLYAENGVLSIFSAKLLTKLLEPISPNEMKVIVDSTLNVFATVEKIVADDPSFLLTGPVKNVLSQKDGVLAELGISDRAIMERIGTLTDKEMYSIFEFIMAEPAVKPRTAPTIAPTRPMPKRPGPVPTKQPFKTPEPAKAEAEDVISRYEELTGKKDEE